MSMCSSADTDTDTDTPHTNHFSQINDDDLGEVIQENLLPETCTHKILRWGIIGEDKCSFPLCGWQK